MAENRGTFIFRPGYLLAVTILASGVAGGIVLFHNLVQAGREKLARRFCYPAVAVSLAAVLIAVFLPLKWHLNALLFLAFNLAAAVTYSVVYRAHERVVPAEPAVSPAPGAAATQIFVGILGGVLIAVPIGGLFEYVYLKFFDAFLSTFLPVGSGRREIYGYFFNAIAQFAFLGAVLGGIWARRARPVTVFDVVRAALGLGWTVFAYALPFTLFFSLPLFHVFGIVGELPYLGMVLSLIWLIYLAAGAFSLIYLLNAGDLREAARRAAAVLTIAVSFNVSFAICGGILSYDFLNLGNYLEKKADVVLARKCYQRSLILRRSDYLSSYLQYRIALLYRKTGDNAKCAAALEKVITSYDKNLRLVETAQKMLARLKEAPPDARRVVIPGIESRTEYKTAYCVPNSLSLVLRYWKVRASAKEIGYSITGLEEGTYVADQVWYTRRLGLNHYLVPLAGIEEVRRYLDRKIPLLVFVPGHVFAVFGYDEALDTIVTYDVGTLDVWIDQPVEDFRKQWRQEFCVLGLVLPPEKEALLEPGERDRIRRLSRGYLQYVFLPHVEEDREFVRRLKNCLAGAPELFFAFNYFYTYWPAEREYLVRNLDLEAEIAASAAFMEKDFQGDFALANYGTVLLDQGRIEDLETLLQRKRSEYPLSGKLLSDLALVSFARGKYDQAATALLENKGAAGRPLLLAHAFAATGARAAAVSEYERILETDGEKEPPPFLVQKLAVHSLIDLCLEKEDYQTIARAAESYLKRYPLDPRVQYYYALAQFRREDQRLSWLEEPERKKRQERIRQALLTVKSLDAEPGLAGKAEELLRAL